MSQEDSSSEEIRLDRLARFVPETPAEWKARTGALWQKYLAEAKPGEERRSRYERYRETLAWRARRFQRLEFDKRICQGCGGKACEVHHVTYERLGAEEMADLVSVCRECHAAIHRRFP